MGGRGPLLVEDVLRTGHNKRRRAAPPRTHKGRDFGLIRLVLVDMDRALGTRDGRPLDQAVLEHLHKVLHAGVLLAPMTARDRTQALTLLRGDESCLQNAVLRDGARVVADGMPLGERTASRLEGARALMRRLGVAPGEVLVLGGASADAELLSAVPRSVATRDSSQAARSCSRTLVPGVREGGVAALLDDVAQAAQWGEEPAFMRADGSDGGLRAELGAEAPLEPAKGHAAVPLLAGAAVVAASFVVYLSDTFPSIAGMMVLSVGLLVGVALFYMGLSQRRDARRAAAAGRAGARQARR